MNPNIIFFVLVPKLLIINIIENILNPDKLDIQHFRNILYDILIYDLDIFECINIYL